MAYTVIFFFFVAYLKLKLKRESKLAVKENVNTQDFSLMIKGLPEEKFTKEDLANFFNHLKLPVHDVHIARRYGGLLDDTYSLDVINRNIRKREVQLSIIAEREGQTVAELYKDDSKLDSLKEKLLEKEKFIRDKYPNMKSTDDLDCIEAYIIFETIQTREKAHDEFLKANSRRCFCCKDYPDKMLFMDKELKLSSTDDPSNIIWENLEISSCSKCLRTTLVYIIMTLFIMMCMSAIYSL